MAILRGGCTDHLHRVIDELAEAGLPAIEVTLNTPGALDALRRASRRLGPAVVLGAGTIRKPSDVDDAGAAGVSLVVSGPVVGDALHPGDVAALAGRAARLPAAIEEPRR